MPEMNLRQHTALDKSGFSYSVCGPFTKNRYVCSGCGIGFDSCSEFSLPDGRVGKNVIIFGVDMSSSVHIDYKKKDILILGFGPTHGLDHTILTAEAQYSINFSRWNRKICSAL